MQDPQSLHKYLYVHGDPIQGTDPSGRFAIALGFAIAFAFHGNIQAKKANADVTRGALAIATIRGFASGYLIGIFIEMLLPVARTHFRYVAQLK